MVPQKIQIPGWPYYLTIDGEVFRDGAKEPLSRHYRGNSPSVTLYNGKGNAKRIYVSKLMRDLYFGGTHLALKHINGSHRDFSYWNLKPIEKKDVPMFGRKRGTKSKPVVETLQNGEENIYPSAAACAKAINFSPQAVTNWCRGVSTPSNGNKYRWEE